MLLITLDQQQNLEIEVGELLTVVVVKAANVASDFFEAIRNLLGGSMKHYEKLIQDSVDTALEQLKQKAKDKGYDGVIGVKIANPTVVTGGVEIIVYGNGFRKITNS